LAYADVIGDALKAGVSGVFCMAGAPSAGLPGAGCGAFSHCAQE
jgi:hypothetical protein